jgi:hypothetical protein
MDPGWLEKRRKTGAGFPSLIESDGFPVIISDSSVILKRIISTYADSGLFVFKPLVFTRSL